MSASIKSDPQCVDVYPPVVVIYATRQPIVYTTFAFLFDPATTAIEIGAVKGLKVPAESSALRGVDALGKLYALYMKRQLKITSVDYATIDTILSKICPTSWVALEMKNAPPSGGTITPVSTYRFKPIAISGDRDTVAVFVGNIAMSRRSITPTYTTTPVQFIKDDDALYSLILALKRSLTGEM